MARYLELFQKSLAQCPRVYFLAVYNSKDIASLTVDLEHQLKVRVSELQMLSIMQHFTKKNGNENMPAYGRCVSGMLIINIFVLKNIYFNHDKISSTLRNVGWLQWH